jgi:transcription antitermination factor NusG
VVRHPLLRGFERKVKANIEQRKNSLEVEEDIYQVEVPMEDVVEIKNGQRKMVNRVRIPGYVLVRMELNEDTWSVVRHTPGVTGFVGNAHNPTPLRFEEAFNMLKSLVRSPRSPRQGQRREGLRHAGARVITEVDFEIGETITIKEGSFAGLPGSISEIKPEAASSPCSSRSSSARRRSSCRSTRSPSSDPYRIRGIVGSSGCARVARHPHLSGSAGSAGARASASLDERKEWHRRRR